MEYKSKECWYSIISYTPNLIRNEKINVGIILSYKNKFYLKTLKYNSKKLKNIFTNRYEINNYKDIINYFTFLIDSISKNELSSSLPVGYSGIDTLRMLSKHKDVNSELSSNYFSIPEELNFDYPTMAESNDSSDSAVSKLFNKLINIYVDSEDENKRKHNIIFQRSSSIFKNLINENKIKKNQRIELPTVKSIKYNADFIFKVNSINLMQASPTLDNERELENWYKKMATLSYKYDETSKIFLLDQNSIINDEKFKNQKIYVDMLNDLLEDKRMKKINIDDESKINDFKRKIEEKGENLSKTSIA